MATTSMNGKCSLKLCCQIFVVLQLGENNKDKFLNLLANQCPFTLFSGETNILLHLDIGSAPRHCSKTIIRFLAPSPPWRDYCNCEPVIEISPKLNTTCPLLLELKNDTYQYSKFYKNIIIRFPETYQSSVTSL